MPITQTSGAAAKLERARLDVYEPGAEPGMPGAFLTAIAFQFNPKEVTFTKGVKWREQSQKQAKSAPPASFTSPEAQKLSLEMFFDATRTPGGDVVEEVEKLFDTLNPTRASQAKTPSPPFVKFSWGSLHSFLGYVSSVSAKYTLFGSDGRPLRAVCAVALAELPTEQKKQNPTSGGLQPRRVVTIAEGDSLAVIAYREYGSASLWREIAAVNGLDDPMRLHPGQGIFLPTAAELVRPAALAVARREVSRARA